MIKGRIFNPLLIVILAFVGSQSVLGQYDPSQTDECRILKGSNSAQFISYEAMSDTSVVLRLHNNSSCEIIVETDDSAPRRLVFGPNGVRIEQAMEPEDGLRLSLHFFVRNSRKNRASKPVYGWGDTISTYKIFPGQSILFFVPLKTFRKHMDVIVPFVYRWEGHGDINMTDQDVSHHVGFIFEDLPPSVLAK